MTKPRNFRETAPKRWRGHLLASKCAILLARILLDMKKYYGNILCRQSFFPLAKSVTRVGTRSDTYNGKSYLSRIFMKRLR